MGTETKYSDLDKPAELLQSELCKVKTYKISYKKNSEVSKRFKVVFSSSPICFGVNFANDDQKTKYTKLCILY